MITQAFYQNDKEQLKPFENNPNANRVAGEKFKALSPGPIQGKQKYPKLLERKMAAQAVTTGAQQLPAVLNPVLGTNDFRFL